MSKVTSEGTIDLSATWEEAPTPDGRMRSTMTLLHDDERLSALVAPLTSRISVGSRSLEYRWSVNLNEIETASGLVSTYERARMSAQFIVAAYMLAGERGDD